MSLSPEEYRKTIGNYTLDKRIAIIADFDLTITEEFQQEPILKHYLDNIKAAYDGKRIVNKVNGADRNNVLKIEKPVDWFKISDSWAEPHNGVAWVSQFLYDVRNGVFPELSKKEMQEKWAPEIKLSPGVPEFIGNLRTELEGKCYIGFYIASVGITDLIAGTSIGKIADGIYASELISLDAIHNHPDNPELQYTMPVDAARDLIKPFGKTECVIKIAKGAPEKLDDLVRNQDLCFSYKNVIYLGDGTSDVSSFSYLQKKGSTVLCVFEEGNVTTFEKTHTNPKLISRIDAFLPRDYQYGSMTYTKLARIIKRKLMYKCKFPSQVLDLYKKRRLEENIDEHKEIFKVVTSHLDNCRECEDIYAARWVPPK